MRSGTPAARARRCASALGRDVLEIEVLDDGKAAVPSPAVVGGHGLMGMRERVGLHGGHLRAGRARRRLRRPRHVPAERGHPGMIKIVLADDQPLVRGGFRLILEAEEDVAVVGEASDGEEAVSAALRLQPDLVLMDVQMPRVDGLEATRRIAANAAIHARVMILTTFERDDYVFEALRAGASGFMLKNATPEDLVRAVRIVAAGEALLAPSVTRRVIEDYAQRSAPVRDDDRLGELTERELEVLRLLATGKSNSELAAHLFLGEGTIKTHVSHVLAKLGLRDRVQAVVFAYESGLVAPGQ